MRGARRSRPSAPAAAPSAPRHDHRQRPDRRHRRQPSTATAASVHGRLRQPDHGDRARGASSGPITVTTPGGTAPPAPAASPSSPPPDDHRLLPRAAARRGSRVTITGTGLTGATAVASAAAPPPSPSTRPPRSPRPCPPGAGTSSHGHHPGRDLRDQPRRQLHRHRADPTITAFAPSSGLRRQRHITGTGLTGATAVAFNGGAAVVHRRLGHPDHRDGARRARAAVPITVTTAGGTATSASSFTIHAWRPRITHASAPTAASSAQASRSPAAT